MKTRFILIDTSHAGNVGAVARAIKVMGFDDLVLVNPRWPDVLQREETRQRASGASDVLARCRIVPTLDSALDGMTHLCATVMTARDFGPPTVAPRTHFDLLLKKEQESAISHAVAPFLPTQPEGVVPPERALFASAAQRPATSTQPCARPSGGLALLFGSERFGMKNEDVYRCHAALSIPTHPQFGSLNLGSAVQVIAYEWRMALLAAGQGFDADPSACAAAGTAENADAFPQAVQLADAQQIAGLLAHWQAALQDIGFLDPNAPKKLMPRLNQLINRAQITPQELHILRGMARQMQKLAHAPRSDGP